MNNSFEYKYISNNQIPSKDQDVLVWNKEFSRWYIGRYSTRYIDLNFEVSSHYDPEYIYGDCWTELPDRMSKNNDT